MSSAPSDDLGTTAVSWVSFAVVNGAGWFSSDTAGQIVTFATILISGGCFLYTRIGKALDDRWLARERAKIQLEAERRKAEVGQ